MWKKQLIALNLALLLLGLTAVPALAAEPGSDVVPYIPPEETVTDARLPELLQLPAWASEDDLDLQNSPDTPYKIVVDGTPFWSDQNASGSQWTYRAEDHYLTLTGYNGGTINASGDLTVYAQNNVTITGSSGGSYGGGGILVDGMLTLVVGSGSVQISGGDGQIRGGDAIYASQFGYGNFAGTNAYFHGGDATSTSAADKPIGGFGINAGFVLLSGSGSVYIYGGDASTYSASNSLGGCGICADTVYIESDCTIRGGTGVYGSPGIYFFSYCEFDVVTASVSCPDRRGSAVYTPTDDTYWYYSKHTTVSGTSMSITITPNRYTLWLYGGGQDAILPGGSASSTSLTDYYPTSYNLTDYIFQRSGHIQLAWTGSGYSDSDPLPLNAYFTPVTNCSLHAYWTEAKAGDIILNALDGRLADGSFYQKFSGAQAALPSQVSYKNEVSGLLGWCTLPAPTADSDRLFSGQWFAAGDTAPSDPDRVTVLYAQETYGGPYAIYHPTAGALNSGGTILVQNVVSTVSDLYVYALDGSQMAGPDGYTFAGWSTQADAGQAEYAPGDKIPLPENTLVHLYAVWEPTEYSVTPESGLTITTIPASKTVRVTLSDWAGSGDYTAVCALYEGDKMVDCAIADDSGVMELRYRSDTPPLCKVFAVNQDWQPIRSCASCTPRIP